ncbi:unnamed protein product [Euphydryas editha]|uniref:Uncharacterized protein n=1 Tax=Euphydryas editha TaxID=104508 RepID=A0AAU9TQX0_EUPED|nr:unnamed protein product [Euphydryas editha]CAH2089566.1 unnamed protein product [Euphydryas editha]
MRSLFFAVASVALLAICVCAPEGDAIQRIPPKVAATPSATKESAVDSGAAANNAGSSKPLTVARVRRDIGGQESDLLPSANDVDVSPFGENSNFDGRGRIKVLPAYLG